jgi:HSP20 family protein
LESQLSLSKKIWSFPLTLNEDFDDGLLEHFSDAVGLTVSEDKKHLYVEVCVPGLTLEEIEMTLKNNIMWIKSEKKEEVDEKKKTFYRKISHSFSYRVLIPNCVDTSYHPSTSYKNGVLKVAFRKC